MTKCQLHRLAHGTFLLKFLAMACPVGSSQDLYIQSLVPKPNAKAAVWKYFGFVPNSSGTPEDLDSPICKYRSCGVAVPAKSGNTTNLYNHIKKHHTSLYAELNASNSIPKPKKTSSGQQATIVECISKTTTYKRTSKEHKELTTAVTKCLAQDMLPLYTVDKQGFRDMMLKANPRYDLPHSDYFRREAIPNLYSDTRQSIQEKIPPEVHFAATTDMWSSITSQPYMSYTIHYIDSSWMLQTHCLQCLYTPEDHTGVNLKEAMLSTLCDWSLTDARQVAITTDSGSNIKLACELLGWTRISCFSHNLDLAVKKSLQDSRIDRVLKLSRKIVSIFSHSWKRKQALKEAQQLKGLPEKQLKADISTRWGSTAGMIERILEQQQALRAVLSNDRKAAHLQLRWQDTEVLEAIQPILTGLKNLTDVLAGEKIATISEVKPLLEHIYDDILHKNQDDIELVSSMKSVIKSDLKSRYPDSSPMMSLIKKSTYLDPRFRTDYFSDDEKVEVEEEIKSEMLDCLDIAQERVVQDHEQSTSVGDGSSEEPPSKKARGGIGALLKKKENQHY